MTRARNLGDGTLDLFAEREPARDTTGVETAPSAMGARDASARDQGEPGGDQPDPKRPVNADRLKAKIAALRAKTKGAGCTEAEAIAAAELAARLMQDHGLTEDELVMTEARSRERTRTDTWRSDLAWTIASVTNTAACLDADGFLFVGEAPGPEIAAYLRDIAIRSVERELRLFKSGRYYRSRRSLRTKRQSSSDFCRTMADRLARRVFKLFADQRDAEVRERAIRALAVRFPDMEAMKDRRRRDPEHYAAVSAGRAAGDRVHLQHGVSTEASRQIGYDRGAA